MIFGVLQEMPVFTISYKNKIKKMCFVQIEFSTTGSMGQSTQPGE